MGKKLNYRYFSSEKTTEVDNSEEEGEPPFTLHIGMLFTAVCRLVTYVDIPLIWLLEVSFGGLKEHTCSSKSTTVKCILLTETCTKIRQHFCCIYYCIVIPMWHPLSFQGQI